MPRIIVSYLDGTWTDNLAVGRYDIRVGPAGLTLAIDVVPRERPGTKHVARDALRNFAKKRGRIATLQIGRTKLAEQLRIKVKQLEDSRIAVELTANKRACVYPAGVVFGPAEITLNLG